MVSPAALARCIPFGLFIVALIISALYPGQSVILIRNLFVLSALAWFWPKYIELRNPPSTGALAWVIGICVGLAVFALWIALDQDWARFSQPALGYDPTNQDGTLHWPLAVARWTGFAVVVPLMEELFWRSFLLRWIQRHDFLAVEPHSVNARAFAITTVLFALEHNQWLAGAIAGAAYNWLYMRSGNLWIAIVAHAVTNGVLGAWIIQTRNWHFW